MPNRFVRAWTSLAASVLLVSCAVAGESASSAPASPDESATATSSPGPVVVTENVRFADAAPREDWTEPLLDVYAREGLVSAPLVMLYPAHGLEKTAWPVYATLANALARAGAVVAVANWSESDNGPASTTDSAVAVRIIEMGQAVAACAAAYMFDHAADYGADTGRIALVGHYYGGSTAVSVALSSPAPVAGCHASDVDRPITVAGGWDIDWMAVHPIWDPFGPDASAIAEVVTPWSLLDSAAPTKMLLATMAEADAASERCDDPESSTAPWLAWRDPTGTMRAALHEIGGLDDGCLAPSESTRAMAAAFAANGVDAEVVRLDASRAPEIMATADIDVLVSTLTAMLEDPAPS